MLSLESSRRAHVEPGPKQEMYFDHFYTLDELIERIENISRSSN